MSKNYENGIVGTTESGHLDITNDIETTGVVYFVNSNGGNDANAGTRRDLPKATLAAAITAATANNGDIIIIEAGHTETVGTAIAMSKAGIKVYGLGTGTSKPSFTSGNVAGCITISAARCEINNLRFPASTSSSVQVVILSSTRPRMINCDFILGSLDSVAVNLNSGCLDPTIYGCTFTASTTVAAAPTAAIAINVSTILGVNIEQCVFNGDTSSGFLNGAIYSAVAHTEYSYRVNTLLKYAHIIHTAAAKGICTGTIAGDGCRVEI